MGGLSLRSAALTGPDEEPARLWIPHRTRVSMTFELNSVMAGKLGWKGILGLSTPKPLDLQS